MTAWRPQAVVRKLSLSRNFSFLRSAAAPTGDDARSTSCTWNGQPPGFSRLRGKANGSVGGAKALIITPLHDLEKEPLVERVGVDLEEFAVAFAVVQNLVVAKRRHRRRVEIVFRLDIVIIVVRNFQEVRTPRPHIRDR